MKAKSFKKFFASIALSAVLTFSTAATAFAATAQLMPVEQSAELSQEQTDTPSVDDSDAQATGASYLTSQAGIAQIAASESSVTVQWTPVTNAAKYAISISPFSSGSYKLLGYFDNSRNKARINKLKAGSAYKVRITALTSSGTSISSRIAGCTTLYSRVTVKTSYASAGGYTFNMNTVNPANSISGYKVIYQSSATHKLITKLIVPGTQSAETADATSQTASLSASTIITVPCGTTGSIALSNTSAGSVNLTNANIRIVRVL